MKFETLAIHAGQEPDPGTGAVTTPVYQTSTYQQEAIGRHKGYEYSRTGNPTRAALETALAALEEGRFGLAFASGVAATTAVFSLLRPGDHVLAGDDLYGGTYRLLEKIFRPWGLQVDYADVDDPGAFARGLKTNTKLVWVETPTNPLMKVIDIAAVAGNASKANALVVVDNTFASPYLQQPLALGADIVVHSTTKYLGGHSDVVGGAVVTSRQDIFERLKFLQNAAGAIPGPFDSWLVLRGLKTLSLRMERHSANAMTIAEFLSRQRTVKRVMYPGLESHPQHPVATRQMRAYGGMLSFIAEGGPEAARRIGRTTRLFTLGESLGGVESLIEVPAAMTHQSVAGSPLEIDPALVRLSVGIENVQDLIGDLQAALEA